MILSLIDKIRMEVAADMFAGHWPALEFQFAHPEAKLFKGW